MPVATGPVFQHAAPLMFRPHPSNFYRYILKSERQTPHPQPALGGAIRELREKRGETLESAGQSAGVAPNTLSLIERGEANPTWETVRGIAAALGVPVSELAKAAERLEG